MAALLLAAALFLSGVATPSAVLADEPAATSGEYALAEADPQGGDEDSGDASDAADAADDDGADGANALDSVSAARPDTALLVMTDWHSHVSNASVQGIASAARDLAATHANVVVVLNGDSEDATSNKAVNTVSAWHKDNGYVTPTMSLVGELTAMGNVQVVMGIGNHELAMNSIGASTGAQLSRYLTTLKNGYGNGRLHIVNTDLNYADAAMAALYEGASPVVERSCTVAGIRFVSGVDPRAVAEECAASKDDAAYAAYGISYAGRKGGLYAPATSSDPLGASKAALASEIASLRAADPNAAIMLLEHSGARSSGAGNGFASFRSDLGLTAQTLVVCGHDHKRPYLYDRKGEACIMQPNRYGEGADIVYARNGAWTRTSKGGIKVTFGEFENGSFETKANPAQH